MKSKTIISSILAVSMLLPLASCSGAQAEPTTAATTAEAKTETPQLEGYNLLWSDEFDGSGEMDLTKWNYEPHEPGWTNNELQEYTTSTDNVFVRDGKLVLKAIKTEKDGNVHYTSGKVTGQNKTDFQYGKVVVSAKVPEGQGLWPAIWMMPKDESYYGQWPKCGEIDIMESLGNDTTISYSTIHYGEPHGEQQGTITKEGADSFSAKFHEYSVEWEPGEMRFYTDGELVLTCNDWFTAVQGEDDKPYPAPFDQPFFVQMNLAVGGNWPGNPDDTTDFDKAEFEIDYVRVYQKDAYDTNVTKPEKPFREALPDGNFIRNGNFTEQEDLTDDVDWKFLLFNEGVGSAEIKDGEMIITTEKYGTEEYSVQLVHPDLPMRKGHSYKITFDIRADEPRKCIVCVSAPNAGWIRYFPDTSIDLTTEWQTFEFNFDMTEKDDNNGRLEFNMGKHGDTATIHITNVRVEEV
ncbi:family 16 glycosylhydrolase [Butyrivibrio sp. AE2032]|uniref:family 16 glycosylhydrolase n=1 Tax=Butyrivibrio sp. AE2032 TaxID=1458463 RepID=UPI00054E21AA|nr:family 16 glycosylhydrolase [Butyrivibrio sp. AE2032]